MKINGEMRKLGFERFTSEELIHHFNIQSTNEVIEFG
jgi:hypothetical protein